ncbi:MAG: glutamate--cysteine ligase [Propionicimonas sp.]|uniref:carboxylate-amine ligase n=1 Tax=Propionicimonas sp. TaxID=1955623 RepID=UPI003D1404CF
MRTVGVEEEFLLVDAHGYPVGVAGAAADDAQVELELMEQMVETGTSPCLDAGDLAEQLRQRRHVVARAAADAGARLVAVATSPQPVRSSVTATARYQHILAEFGLTAREQLTCGCHVHVEVADADEGVAVLDRIGPWLPTLLALSANSPFWQGQDSGYASYRSQVWRRWPTAGPSDPFGSADAYEAVLEGLIASGAALDSGMVYFDARLSQRYPTVEVRVADVCLRSPHALLLALLARALVETAARGELATGPAAGGRAELLRAAAWRAARSGLRGPLVHPLTLRQEPADAVVAALLEQLRPVLAEQAEWELAQVLWTDVLTRGTGAQEQRGWASGGLSEVLRHAAEATLASHGR